MGYSLWLIPPRNSSLRNILQSIIHSFGGSFAPHVTLTSKIPLTTSKDEIQSFIISYFKTHSLPDVHLKQLDKGEEFFKRIFVRCDKTDSLVSFARSTHEVFVKNSNDLDQWSKDYDPHISLIYAEKKDCHDEQLISRIDLSTIIDQTWRGGQIHLVDTTDQLDKWKTVLEFDLSSVD